MLELFTRTPASWWELATIFLAPIAWIPGLQRLLIDFFIHSSSVWTAMAKYVVLALPALLLLVALWCTQLSLYTLPFRSRRMEFLSTLLLTWWDALRAAWLYWVGVIRVGAVLIGWLLAAAGLVVTFISQLTRDLVRRPVSATGRLAGEFVQPGVPWLALMMLVLWCALEATIFTYMLLPSVAATVAGFVGVDQLPALAAPLLWCVLFLLVTGSFVCIKLLIDAVAKRDLTRIVPIVLVELFVMLLEVAFLYRELAEAITPWLVQESGGSFRPGAWVTFSMARFGWVATRGMAWYLFAQYGVPPLVALISRRPLAVPERPRRMVADELAGWPAFPELFKHQRWFHQRWSEVLEYLGAPILHLIAAALNFPRVVVTAQPLFSLPFQGRKEWPSVVLLTDDSRS